MAEHSLPPEKQKVFWDQAARDDVLPAIFDAPGTRDPETAQACFDAAGAEAARSLLGFVHPEARVLDLGCGIGRVLRPLAAHCKEIVGVDVSPEMLTRARTYLDGVQNVQLVQTPGRTLPGIADASLDFVYSLLCLIHVDRRSTYRYLGEIRRVLRPGGVAYLQFQDLTTDKGFRKFLDVVDTDVPLEFYTVPEVRCFLEANGLEPLSIEAAGEYVTVTAVGGSVEDWVKRTREGFQVRGFEARGSLAGARFDADQDGDLVAQVKAGPETRLSVRLVLALGTQRHGPIHAKARVDGFLPLESDRTMVLRFGYSAGEQPRLFVSADDMEVREVQFARRGPLPAGRVFLSAAMLPLGQAWDDATMARFPDCFLFRELELSRTIFG